MQETAGKVLWSWCGLEMNMQPKTGSAVGLKIQPEDDYVRG
jgi:hypothetical protein